MLLRRLKSKQQKRLRQRQHHKTISLVKRGKRIVLHVLCSTDFSKYVCDPLHNDDVKSPNFDDNVSILTENLLFSVFTLKPLVPIYFWDTSPIL